MKLIDGAWRGHPAYIIGGGPSLRGFDRSRLNGCLCVLINEAWQWRQKGVAFCRDRRYARRIVGDLIQIERAACNLDSVAEPSIFLFVNGSSAWASICEGMSPLVSSRIEAILSAGHKWGRSFSNGIVEAPDSGLGALNVATILGADPIYLLGFDMTSPDPKRTANWHDNYPDEWRSNPCVYAERFIPYYEKYASEIAKCARVVNLNPASALRCFEFGDIDKVLP